jgi:hypothetical protein
MKLTLTPNPTFTCVVDIHVPGEQEKGQVKITYKAMSQPEAAKFFDNAVEKNLSPYEIVKDLVAGWDLDEAFTPDNLKQLTDNYFGAANALLDTYMRELTNNRVGN